MQLILHQSSSGWNNLSKILQDNNLESLGDKFLELSYQSKKWTKWMVKDYEATDYEKSLIVDITFSKLRM